MALKSSIVISINQLHSRKERTNLQGNQFYDSDITILEDAGERISHHD